MHVVGTIMKNVFNTKTHCVKTLLGKKMYSRNLKTLITMTDINRQSDRTEINMRDRVGERRKEQDRGSNA